MKKRKFCKLFVIFLMLGMMGCRGEAGERLKENGGEKQNSRKELTLWSYYETDAQKKGLDKLIRGFNESQDKYKLTWDYVPMADFIRTLSFAQSGDNLPDMVLADNPDIGSLIKVGLLADITRHLEKTVPVEEYYTEVWKFAEDKGCCYGVPFCCNNTAIIYNKKLFRKKDIQIPETWEEFRETAAILTEEEKCYGFAMSATAGEQGAFQFMPWMLAAGADTEHMAGRKGKNAFRLMDNLLQDKSMPNDCLNWSQNDVTTSFIAGETAMMENGPWSLAELEASGIEYGIFRFPGRDSAEVVLGGEVLAAVNGMDVEGVISFINYYNRKEVMQEICQITGNIPPKAELAKEFVEKNPAYQVFVEQMEQGICRNSIKGWKEICNAISDSLNRIFGSEDTVDEIWEDYVENLGMK
ncbi:MAG: extracellular solute-binding protein [Lachnospiraceae bacterium]|nr:extracellular solute-binding protein [Lachnospiraceae bacterium]